MILNFTSSTNSSAFSTFLPILLASPQKHFKCFWNPVRKLLSLCLPHHNSQEVLVFPWFSTFYSPIYVYPLFYFSHFAISVYVRSIFICHTQLNTRRLLAHLPLFQDCFSMVRHPQTCLTTFILSHLFLFVALPCLCPPSLGTGSLPWNVTRMEIWLPPGRKKMSSMLQMLHHFKMKPYS